MKEYYLKAANGEGQIYVRSYPVEQPRAFAQILHDMNSHCGRYQILAENLNDIGVEVIMMDIVGHGLSKQGHPGAFAMKEGGLDSIMEDMHGLFDRMNESHDRPHILISDGLSDFIAEEYSVRYDEDVDELVLMGHIKNPTALSSMIATAHNHTLRKGYNSTSQALLTLLQPPAMTGGHESSKFYWVSSDPEQVKAYIDDPDCGIQLTASSYAELLEATKDTATNEWAEKMPNIPIMILSGADDIRGEYSSAARDKAGQLWDTNHDYVELKVYPGCMHDLLHEKIATDVCNDIVTWVDKNLDEDN